MEERILFELVIRDFKELSLKLKDKSFVDAYNMLDSFNLETYPIFSGDVLIGIETFFDFNYKSLNGTIKCENGKCKIHTRFDIWLENMTSPIAMVDIKEGKPTLVKWNF